MYSHIFVTFFVRLVFHFKIVVHTCYVSLFMIDCSLEYNVVRDPMKLLSGNNVAFHNNTVAHTQYSSFYRQSCCIFIVCHFTRVFNFQVILLHSFIENETQN